ncbi:MAG: MxaK protein [Gammaproteobacteria bacterium]|nr:MxaK protein [Gammaproteobacteria bacterium]
MINSLHIAHWALVAIAGASTLGAGHAGWTLSQTNKLNSFISNPSEIEQVPEHKKAQFAKAFDDAENGHSDKALERLTTALTTVDPVLEAAAYFNRANIHLREVVSLPPADTGRAALLGLAKQDYRNALLIDSSLWNARFNLEYALLLDPEEAGEMGQSEWGKKGSSQVIVKAVGFRVDLP